MNPRRSLVRAFALFGFFAASALGGAQLAAQTPAGRPLSLEEALRMAEQTSEQIEVARAGVTRARGNQLQARSAYFPQLNGSASYSRTLASQFEAFRGAAPDSTAPAPCPPFVPDPTLPLDERVGALEGRVGCPAESGLGGIDLSNAGFGSENTYNLGLALVQPVYTGGRIPAQNRIARAGRETAEIAMEASRAQLALDVTQAYYDAALSGQLLDIAEAVLAQAEATLRQTELGEQVGNVAEFDLLRARVTRDNQRPVVIQRRAERDVAYFRLKQLLDLPLDEELALTSDLGEDVPAGTVSEALLAEARAPVRQAAEAVEVQRAQLRIAQSQRLPNLSLTSQYGRVAYPQSFVPEFDQFRTNWTVGANLQVPIFTGGRIRGDVLVAEAGVTEARARLEQTRKLAALDTRSAIAQLTAARAAWEASAGVVEQAERAYAIAELRFREGISTQLELSDARLLLEQARANRAQVARNLQIAQRRIELLPDLPLGVSGAGNGAAGTQLSPTQQSSESFQTAPQQAGTTNPSQASFPGAGVP